jgi:hypothetical protein
MPTPEEKEAWEVRWGPHLVKLRMGIVDGRPAIIALEMSGGPITSTDLRLPLATLLSEHLELVRRDRGHFPVGFALEIGSSRRRSVFAF